MTEPTEAEIWQMWMPMVRRMGVADPVDFARAVLAKWGSINQKIPDRIFYPPPSAFE